jgi:hypothetical protein
MKKIILTFLFCIFLNIFCYADFMKTHFWTGYTTISMKSFYNRLDNQIKNSNNEFDKYNKVNTALIYGMDFNMMMTKNFGAGFRFSYLKMEPIIMTSFKKTDSYQGYSKFIKQTHSYNFILIPVMVGFMYQYPLSNRFFYTTKIYSGYGFFFKNGISGNYEIDGSGPVSDFSIGTSLKITDNLSLGLDIGYRYALIKDKYNNSIEYDFSGIMSLLNLIFTI